MCRNRNGRDFESAARREGVADFQFRELNPGHPGLVAAAHRPEYVPVYYIAPLDGNSTALGYDLASDCCRRQSLERARDLGEPTATAPVYLAQEKDRQPGLLVLLPVYHGATPATVDERRQQLAGFAVAVFRVGDLAGNALGGLERQGIHARLFDDSTSGELIYPSSVASKDDSFSNSAAEVPLQIAGRRWVVEYAPSPSSMPPNRTNNLHSY